MKSTNLKFMGSLGESLSGVLDEPEGHSHATAILCHCFTCNKDYKGIKNLSRYLASYGISTYRFDFTGLGESDGNFANTNFSTMVDDLFKAYLFISENFNKPKLLVGLSMGGAAVVRAGIELDDIKAIATIGAPYQASDLGARFAKQKSLAFMKGSATVIIGGVEYELTNQFFIDLEINGSSYDISQLSKPILVLHSPIDDITPYSTGLKLFTNANSPKSFISLDSADHLLSDKLHSEYAASLIAEWAKYYFND